MDTLLAALSTHGFTGLKDGDAETLSVSLEELAKHSGRASWVFLAQAISAAHEFRMDHDERGGIRDGFLARLDDCTIKAMPHILNETENAPAAKNYRDSVIALVAGYNAIETCEES